MKTYFVIKPSSAIGKEVTGKQLAEGTKLWKPTTQTPYGEMLPLKV